MACEFEVIIVIGKDTQGVKEQDALEYLLGCAAAPPPPSLARPVWPRKSPQADNATPLVIQSLTQLHRLE